MAWDEEAKEAMDAAALKADNELRKMSQKVSVPIAIWFKENYLKAGHKRLGRILVNFAKETEKIPVKDRV